MIKQKVWQTFKKKTIPNNHRLIGSKWVLKLKCDSTYCARLLVLGYSRIPGVNITDNFATMLNNITFCSMLSRKLIKKVYTRIIDMEMALLYGGLEDEISMETQEGCAILDKGIYRV